MVATHEPEVKQAKAVFRVLNDKGLHTRPATELVKCAARFQSRMTLTHHGMTISGKSLLNILMLAASRGARITIEAEGLDATELVDSVLALAKNKFNIQY